MGHWVPPLATQKMSVKLSPKVTKFLIWLGRICGTKELEASLGASDWEQAANASEMVMNRDRNGLLISIIVVGVRGVEEGGREKVKGEREETRGDGRVPVISTCFGLSEANCRLLGISSAKSFARLIASASEMFFREKFGRL